MRFKYLTVLFLFSCFCFSCWEEGVSDTDLSAAPTLRGKSNLLNRAKDTLLTGVPIPADGKRRDPRTLATPVAVPLKGRPKVVFVQTNYQVKNEQEVKLVPAELRVISPGENGIPRPLTEPARSERVPIQQPKPLPALPPRIKDAAVLDIQYLDVDQGMISSYIRSIFEDSSGNLWFGTSHGLSRYDGNSFLHYTTEAGLLNNTILSMLEDRAGQLWFGTGNGISRYDGSNFFHYQTKDSFKGQHVRSILEDPQGNLWFATSKGVIRYEPDKGESEFTYYTTREGLISDDVLSMLIDRQGNLWFGTSEGLNKYDHTYFTHYTTEEGLIRNAIYSMLEDSEGNLWFGTDKGMSCYRYDNDRATFTNYINEVGLSDQNIVDILEDGRGNLWFGTGNGAFRYNGSYFVRYGTQEGFSDETLRSILQDSQGNLWFGTGGGGVNRLNDTGFIHYTMDKGLSDNGVVCMVEDRRGNLWFGTGKGVNLYNPDKNPATFTYYTTKEGLLSNDINCLLEDKRGNLWIGTNKGLSCLVMGDNGDRIINYTTAEGLIDNDVISMLEDSKGNLWLGTDKGLSRYTPGNKDDQFIQYTTAAGLRTNRVISMLEDSSGNLWFATSEGVSRYTPDPGGGYFIHYTTAEGLIDNEVWSILEDSSDDLWLGTSKGVSRYLSDRDSSRFVNYTTKDGLSDNLIWSLLEDRQGNIWISTEKGITLLKPRSAAAGPEIHSGSSEYQFFTFKKEDGLKRIDFQANSAMLDNQNRIWWGSEGLTMLDLDKFQPADEVPGNLRINQIEINQRFVDYRRLSDTAYRNSFQFGDQLLHSFDSVTAFYNYPVSMTLPYNLNHLTFHFSAIDWASPHKIEYRYYMEELEEDWNDPSSKPNADYRNIPSGSYTFHLSVRGASKRWSDPFKYRFSIRPPWWHTWWAWGAYALALLVIVLWFLSFFKKRLLLQNDVIRLKELNDFKSRLYTNLTHEFRTPLTIILGMADQIKSDPGKRLQEHVALIRSNGRQLLRLINQLLDLSKLENESFQLQLQQGDVVAYLRYLIEAFIPYVESRNLFFQFSNELEEVIMDYDPEQIKQMMTNLISNAVKFTPSGGTIEVKLGRQQEELKIEVIDSGVGLSQKDLAYIFDRFYQVDDSSTRKVEGTGIGLAHTKELVKLMGGEIRVESELNVGTKFEVLLPIQQAAGTPVASTEGPGIDAENLINVIPFSPVAAENPVSDSTQPIAELPYLLIIENNHDMVTYLKACLAGSYQLDIAFDGKTGIEKALINIPDLIISDVMMPEKDGFEVCNTLKADERTSHIPIILLTAKVDAKSRYKGLETGADAYLNKPFDKAELLIRIEKMVEKQKRLTAHFNQKFQHGFVNDATIEPPEIEVQKEDAFIERVRKIVDKNYVDENFSLTELCEAINMSRSNLYRKMSALINTSPSIFIKTYRLEKAEALLRNSNLNVSEVARKTGYKNASHFSKSFQKKFGYPPSALK